MHTLQKAFRCELSQITPDGVFGQFEFLAEVFGYHLAVSPQEVENLLFALTGEHKDTIAQTGVFARKCMTLHEFSYFGIMVQQEQP